MSRLVERFGRTGFAAISSVIWALPMAAWAGSSDLSPVDKTATPTIAFTIGAVMFVVWLILIANLGRIQVSRRQRRFDIGQMSTSEKRWTLACIVFATGLIAWLNAAATVDWAPLGSAIGAGKVGPITIEGAPPILLVGGTGDPSTPYAQAQAVSKSLPGSVLLTREGNGHVSYSKSACAKQAIDAYLIDLKVPAAGTVCKSG